MFVVVRVVFLLTDSLFHVSEGFARTVAASHVEDECFPLLGVVEKQRRAQPLPLHVGQLRQLARVADLGSFLRSFRSLCGR